MSLSGINASDWLHRPYWHTLDNSHQALGDISFVQLFYWKKLCQDSWRQTSVMLWISTVGQGVTHFPIFLYPFCRRPGKKCFIESCLVSTVTCDTPHSATCSLSTLWFRTWENKPSLKAWQLLFWDSVGPLSQAAEESLSQILSCDYGFPSPIISMEIKTSSDTAGDSQMWEMKGNEESSPFEPVVLK